MQIKGKCDCCKKKKTKGKNKKIPEQYAYSIEEIEMID